MLKRLWSTQSYALDVGLLVLRLTMAALMITHGWPKFTTFGENASTFPDPLNVGSSVSLSLTIFAELICSCFLFLGLFTRFALIPLLINMLVIIFVIHANDLLEIKEHALLFLGPYITLFLAGPGRYSLDRLLKR